MSKYPLKTHKTGGFFPASGKCGYCGKPNEGKFVAICYSAMKEISPKTFAPINVKTSFSLKDHGVTQSGRSLTIFQDGNDAYFCSISCLRQFFIQIVNDFENGG